MIELIQVSRDLKGTARWVEPALERVRAMAHRWGANGDSLVDATWKMFAERNKLLGLWVGVQGDEIVGHALADIRLWDDRPVVWILQVETDVAVGRAYRDFVLKTIDEWSARVAEEAKITLDRQVMSTPRMNDPWARHSGFTPYRFLYERPIPKRRG